jgi:mono/diheme cytochrome c family protein
MLMRVFLLSILLFGTTLQAQGHGPGRGWYPCQQYTGEDMRYRGQGMGRHHPYRGGGRHGGAGGFCGSRVGGRGCGGHGWWDIPVQEARRLNPIEVSPQSLEIGETLFRENCSSCHGNHGFGDGPQAKGLRIAPPNLHHAARHYSDGELFYIIRKGRDPMPAWESKLSEDQMWNLINYLRFQLGAHRPGPRMGHYTNPYQSGGMPTDAQIGRQKETQDEHQDHHAMGQEDMHGETCDQNRLDTHDDHQQHE